MTELPSILCRSLSGLVMAQLFCCVLMAAAPSNDESLARQQQAARLLGQGQGAEALEILMPLVRETPNSARLQALLGAAQYMERRYLAAAESLRQAVDLGQQDLRTVYFLCSALWENGELEDAEAVCRSGIAILGPQLPLVHLLGRLYLWQARYEESVDWLEKAVSRSAGSVDLWLDLAGALEGGGREQDALEALNSAVALAPEHYQVRYGLARMLQKAGDREGAQRQFEIYQSLLEEDQERTLREGRLQAQIDLAYEHLRLGDAALALSQLESLPLSVEVLLARAEAWQQMGDRQSELAALEQAVALDPSRRDLRSKLAAARLEEREPQ